MFQLRRMTVATCMAAIAVVGPMTAVASALAPASDIDSQPQSQTVVAGDEAQFSSDADCDCTEQWQVSTDSGSTFTNIPGATDESLSFVAAADDNGNQYRAEFTESEEDVHKSAASLDVFDSDAATLSVLYPPVVTTQPTRETIIEGDSTDFYSAATGNPTPDIQWQVSTDDCETFTDISGQTSSTLAFTTTWSDAGHCYRAEFTNDAVATPQLAHKSARADDDQVATVYSNPVKLHLIEPVTTVTPPKHRHHPGNGEEGVHKVHCYFGHHRRRYWRHHEYVCPILSTGTATGSSGGIYFTSPDHAVFVEGTEGSVTVSATDDATITDPPGFPTGIVFTSGEGTATIAGTAAFGTVGTYQVPLTAHADGEQAHQMFTLTVLPANRSGLPFTGAPTNWELLVAFALLLAGVGLQLGGRRRRIVRARLVQGATNRYRLM